MTDTPTPGADENPIPGANDTRTAMNRAGGLELVPLPGSARAPVDTGPPTPEPRSAPLPDEAVEATIVLRRRADVSGARLSGPGLDRDRFAHEFGADPDDVDTVVTRLTGLGLRLLATDPGSRRVRVSGSVADVERVFGTTLAPAELSRPGGVTSHRVRAGGLSIPADLAGIVTAVLGLDDRPQTRAQYRIAPARAVTTSYTPLQLATVYDFPSTADGRGQTVAIIELGGGFRTNDLDAYFAGLGLSTPKVSAVGVDGASNQPGDPNGADGEVMLDIEVVGALAPAADIIVYFAPNTDAGFLDAVSQAAHGTPTPVAISISWGQTEEAWTEQARRAMDDAFVDAAALGVTVSVAAGDDGSRDQVADGGVHVDFPAASPHALACGGTRLEADPATGRVDSETVWNNGGGAGATGGGFSALFGRPDYQSVTVTGPGGRGIPDVAAVADPQTGYRIRVDGRNEVIGGTSAVAPLWAALVARLAQVRGQRFGLIQPLLYASAQPATVADGFRDVVQGTNGAYAAGPGWDACTGLGVPVGSRLAVALSGPAPSAPAGDSPTDPAGDSPTDLAGDSTGVSPSD